MPNEVQKRIIYLRKQAGKTQQDMANDLNMKRTTYDYNETKAKRLSNDFIEKVAAKLKASTNYILYGLNEDPKTVNEPKPGTDIPFILTNSERKMFEQFKCLSFERQADIKKMIFEEYKERFGIKE